MQYLDMFTKATLLKASRVVIVAFYSGNDPLESALLAGSVERWKFLKPDPAAPLPEIPSTKRFMVRHMGCSFQGWNKNLLYSSTATGLKWR